MDAQVDGSSDGSAQDGTAADGTTDVQANDVVADGPPPSTIAELPVASTERIMGLDGPVDVVIDRQGWPHIYSNSVRDVAYVQGYLCARDRMPQMEMLRRLASGTLAEKFGGLSGDLIERDLAMRVVGLRRAAERMWAAVPMNSRSRTILEGYAAGVNHWLGLIRNSDRTTPAGTELVIDELTPAWTPVDSLTIARFQSFSLSYDAEDDVNRSELRDRATQTFAMANAMMQPERARRAAFLQDFLRFAPVSEQATVPNFLAGLPMMQVFRPSTAAPTIGARVYQDVQGFLRNATASAEFLGDQSRGSNNWVLHGSATMSGRPLLANDPHLSLTSPAVWWGVHLTVKAGPDAVDVAGTSFPGIPWVVIGYNRKVAWGVTTAGYDVTDTWAETIVRCANGMGDCVQYDGREVPLQTLTEAVPDGIGGMYMARFEVVPHHGIILPTIRNRMIVPRVGNTAISMRWTGNDPTTELECFMDLAYTNNITEARAAVRRFGVGAQNFVLADVEGNTGYQSSSVIPVRGPGALNWDPATGQGNMPCFVLPGNVANTNWNGNVPEARIPQGTGSAMQPFFATANQDQTGVTFDNNPVNDPVFLGCDFADGIRMTRITERLRAIRNATVQDMQQLQGDTVLLYGRRYRPFLLSALNRLNAEWMTPNSNPDLTALATALMPRQALIRAALAKLTAWTFDGASGVPNAMGEMVTATQQQDAIATSIFHGFLNNFGELAFGDEMAAMGYSRRSYNTKQIAAGLYILEHGTDMNMATRARTGEALWDDLGTPAIETRDQIIVRAIDAGLTQLASFTRSQDINTWYWGNLHTLRLESIVPGPGAGLSIPPAGEAMYPNGFPRPGGLETVDASHPRFGAMDFAYSSGPSQRFVVDMDPAGPRGYNSLPGGQVFNRTSRHHRDLMELWRRNQYFSVPRSEAEVVAAHEQRLRFEPM
jgi:penicillin amidase